MIALIVLLVVCSGYYFFTIGKYLYYYSKISKVTQQENLLSPKTTFTIIIAVRNEEDAIAGCIESVKNLDYPQHLFEVLIIDDDSTDHTLKILQKSIALSSNIKLLFSKDYNSAEQSFGKKKAIEYGILNSCHEWIVTTDGDCLVPADWLSSMDHFIQLHLECNMVVAPVNLIALKGLGYSFQHLEFLSFQGMSAAMTNTGTYCLCNGANLAYLKKCFYEVGGFKGINEIPSGDDMLLMEKFLATYHSTKIKYLFDFKAIVKTYQVKSLIAFLNQRNRWGSKLKFLKNKIMKCDIALALLFHLLLIMLLFIGLFHTKFLFLFLFLFLLKIIIEGVFLYKVMQFFKSTYLLKNYVLIQCTYLFYIIIMGIFSLKQYYSWKGRDIK